MTSHYMRIMVKDSFRNVFGALSGKFGNIYARKHEKSGTSSLGIILDEKFFFRVESDAALLIVVKEISDAQTEVEVLSCAGGHGLMGISYSAHSDYAHDVITFLEDSGFKTECQNEIDYFDREKCRLLGEK